MSPYVAQLVALALAGVFAWSAVLKLRDLRTFERSLTGWGLPPGGARAAGAAGVVLVELVGPALVVAGKLAAGMAVLVTLLIAFSVITWHAWRRNSDLECTCLTASPAPVGPWNFGRNAVLVLAAVAAAASAPAHPAPPGPLLLVGALLLAFSVLLTDSGVHALRS